MGAVILTGAMIAVFYYENTNADGGPAGEIIGEGENRYRFQFVETEPAPVQKDGTATANGGTVTFDVPAYTYYMHFTVTWANDGVPPLPPGSSYDSLTVEVIKPDGEPFEDAVTEADGTIEIQHDHTEDDNLTTPAQLNITVAADSPEEANTTLRDNLSQAHGAGTWTVRVTWNNGGAAAVPTDTNEAFTAELHYMFWDAEYRGEA